MLDSDKLQKGGGDSFDRLPNGPVDIVSIGGYFSVLTFSRSSLIELRESTALLPSGPRFLLQRMKRPVRVHLINQSTDELTVKS
jgi:hypothetical protein